MSTFSTGCVLLINSIIIIIIIIVFVAATLQQVLTRTYIYAYIIVIALITWSLERHYYKYFFLQLFQRHSDSKIFTIKVNLK